MVKKFMVSISAKQIKELRDETGVSIMLCRKALEESGGDKAKAKAILGERGAEAAAKKAGRALGAGTIAAYLHQGGVVGALVELSSETDFVSGNAEFKALAHDIAMQVAAANPESVEALLEQSFIKNQGQTIRELMASAIQKFGEKIEIARFAVLRCRR